MPPLIAPRLALLAFVIVTAWGPFARPALDAQAGRVRPVAWAEAQAIVQSFPAALPDVTSTSAEQQPDRWQRWVASQRDAVARRLARGEEDSLANLLLFGTGFTTQPRLTTAFLADLERRWAAGDRSAAGTLTRAYQQRATDLIAALARPAPTERMRLAREMLERRGHLLGTVSGRARAQEVLLEFVVRAKKEAGEIAARLEAARKANDDAAANERATLFRERGLAPDSSVLTQFAVDRAICEITRQQLLPPGQPWRVAVIGPGLDFADKEGGFDFYDAQSLQPFTLLDSLARCGRAAVANIDVTAIDISPLVLEHLGNAARRGQRGLGYPLVLPWDETVPRTDAATAYWRRAGDHVGRPAGPGPTPPVAGVRARSVRVPGSITSRIRTLHADIVLDRVELSENERFHLVLATNVLLYYDPFQQALALSSIVSLLEPAGIFVTNDVTNGGTNVASLRPSGTLVVPFSSRRADGERMSWFTRARPTP